MFAKRFIPTILALTLLSAGALAGDGPAPAERLGELGVSFEQARLLSPDRADTTLAALLPQLDRVLDDDLDKDRESVARLLWGEIEHRLGRFDEAAKAFARVAKKADDRNLRAAAALAGIEAREGAGGDAEAIAERRTWLADNSDHPLAGEARLGLAWALIRTGDLEAAAKEMEAVAENDPWLDSDPRRVLALATIDFLEGRPQQALPRLAPLPPIAPALFLRALCQQAAGQPLPAAASFQEVAQRHRFSPLHDHALLAKADIFMTSGAYASAAEEFARVVESARIPAVVAEASLRRAASVFLSGDSGGAEPLLREVAAGHPDDDVGARAQYLLGELMLQENRYEDAIVEFNRVLSVHFQQSAAASAQYRVGRSFDALDRRIDAVGAYQAVVSGYPAEPEAPAAAYLAGVGLMELGRPRDAVPYFQLVLDRYAARSDAADPGSSVFVKPEHGEIVEAALCLLSLSLHQSGDYGQLAGVTHALLQRLPDTESAWRGYTLLIDADALAAQGQSDLARSSLDALAENYPGHPAQGPATQLQAWIHAQAGEFDLAIAASRRLLTQYGADTPPEAMAQTQLTLAHVEFNRKRYDEAASVYEEFIARHPGHPDRLLALYQAGLCYLRLDRDGDAVDRWESIVAEAPATEIAERAWRRAGDLYFQAEHFDDAKRCYQGLLENFSGSSAAPLGLLRIAQCDYNAGRDAEALAGFAVVMDTHPGSPFAAEAERGVESALFRLGEGEGGIEALRELVTKYPDGSFAADAQFRIGQSLYDRGDNAAAAAEFRRVVSRYPGYENADRAQYLMADALQKSGDVAAAREASDQFLIFFADSELRTGVQFKLGMLCFEQQEYMRAAMNFTGVLSGEPEPDVGKASQFNLALCKRLLGDYAGARTELLSYRLANPGDERAGEIAFLLGDLNERLGDSAAAIEEFGKALAANPSGERLVELQYRLGLCHENLGDDDAALAAYGRAAAKGDGADTYRLSAVARCAALYEARSDFAKAMRAYRDLIANARDPELVEVAAARVRELESVLN